MTPPGRLVGREEALRIIRNARPRPEADSELAERRPPPPLIPSRPVRPSDDLGSSPLRTLATAESSGWSASATFSRGTMIHGTTGRALRIVDSVVVRGSKDGQRWVAWWTTPIRDRRWKIETCWWLTPLRQVGHAELMQSIKEGTLWVPEPD